MKGPGLSESKSGQGSGGSIMDEDTGSGRLAVTFPRKDGLGCTHATCKLNRLCLLEIKAFWNSFKFPSIPIEQVHWFKKKSSIKILKQKGLCVFNKHSLELER